MKRLQAIVVLLFSFICVFTSCEKAPFLTINTPGSINFTEQGGTQKISFTANRDWTVSSSETWCKISPSSGLKSDGEVSFTITCNPNTTYDSRNATVTIKAEELVESITVTQDTNIGLVVTPLSYDIGNRTQRLEVTISTNVDYSVNIDKNCQEWISLTNTKALSSTGLVLSVAENNTYNDREGRVIIRQTNGPLFQTIIIRQGAKYGLFVSPDSYELSNESQTIEIEVNYNVAFDVIIPEEDNGPFVYIIGDMPATKALSSNKYRIGVRANLSDDDRETTITFKQRDGELCGTVYIHQEPGDISVLKPYVLFSYSSRHISPIQIIPVFANWTIFWGSGVFSYWPDEASHVFNRDGVHDVLLSGSEITDFIVSVKGLDMIDLSSFE
ncbi:MAG: BACON domain-containing protein [Bacteroidales bacterium]|nr:BACON domain-containing protein [Bacteroidales bacterium]